MYSKLKEDSLKRGPDTLKLDLSVEQKTKVEFSLKADKRIFQTGRLKHLLPSKCQ